ncbi:MAG: transglutaminase-like domain-containing protein, partial [Akkermansiaceae bacterium]|nr:transglutaminase-like domain-containing protein [Akkermansiaceae bacterium]
METNAHPPPRLLLGATLLFWGAMTGNPFLALLAALTIEAANWMHFRWDFNDRANSRAWRLSMALTIITAALIWLDGDRYTALPKLIVWLPILFLPLQFVQSYGLCNSMALNSFSFFTHLHQERNRRLGMADSVIRFNFGNPYFVTLLISASLGTNAHQIIFLPALILLSGWLVFSRVKVRPFALILLVFFAGIFGFSGQIGMEKLYKWANELSGEGGYGSNDPTESKTSIGSLGRIKQSSEMLWRVKVIDGNRPPSLLRLSSYNRFRAKVWRNRFPPEIEKSLVESEGGFIGLRTVERTLGEPDFLMREEMTEADLSQQRPSYSIRGAARPEDSLPLPGSSSSVRQFDLDGIEINPLGTVRIFPKKSVIEGTVRWGDLKSPEDDPWPELDLAIDPTEQETLDAIVAELGLKDLPTIQAKTARISQWFRDEFTYTRYLTIGNPQVTIPTPLSIFLTNSKRGHCEYFATAGTLLLRAAGAPARYCVGFAIAENDTKRKEWIIRGTHAHAWVRAWDAERGTWIDFDPTPPGWLDAELGNSHETPWLADAYQRIKEDFFLWRNRPANRLAVTIVMWVLGLGVLAFIARRLWKSKLVVSKNIASPYSSEPPARTPLHDLEKPATRILGARPTGLTFAGWLQKLTGYDIPAEPLDEALQLHQRMRFDPQPTDPSLEQRLTALVDELSTRIR